MRRLVGFVRTPWASFILVWVFLAFISQQSGYRIADVLSMNWDIALMLSPLGFITNFWWKTDSYLRPYYEAPAERGSFFADPVLAGWVIMTAVTAALGLWRFRRMRP